MKTKSDVQHSADELFNRYGVLTALISDNVKEIILGDLTRKFKIARCNIDTKDPYSSWQTREEAEIQETKRMTGRWKVLSRSPRRLWCYCVELDSLMRSHTA